MDPKPTKLDFNTKYKVEYRIPLWLRNEQIKSAVARPDVGRLQPVMGADGKAVKREEPVAIVCYGPSLQDTWEKIRDFKRIISMSGSGKFLIERGIIPTWHTAVDPCEATVQLIGTPHKDVEYLISSTCHQKVFDHLKGMNVKLWHVFDPGEDSYQVIPRGEWAFTGGQNVGLRSMAIARCLGFTDLHIFGMDGSDHATRGKHAGAHPEQAKDRIPVEYPEGSGKLWYTTVAFLECAKQTWHELDQLPDVKAVFYGEGLVQEMAKHYVPKPVAMEKAVPAVLRPETISPAFKELNSRLHRENLAYGVGGGKHVKTVLKMCEDMKTTSVLDYGAGKGMLAKEIPFPIWEYDPAIPGKDIPPRPADLVVCTDVLEHIEPGHLAFVLDDLRRVARKLGYFVIHLGPAQKFYADGRNTHLIQESKSWWVNTLQKFFGVVKTFESKNELHVWVQPKVWKKKAKHPPTPEVLKAAQSHPSVLRVVIGGARKDRIPALVAEWSIKKHAIHPVEIIHTWDKDLPKRPCPTGFSYVRLQVPALCGYDGLGLYMDSDQIMYADVAELVPLMRNPITKIHVMRPRNQTAVMLYDCAAERTDIRAIFEQIDSGKATYQDIIWNLPHIPRQHIGFLPDEWNLCDQWREGGKILHYTKVATQPWLCADHPLGKMWYDALRDAVKDGAITVDQIAEDEKLGFIKVNVLEGVTA